ncbi:MAG: hypothetical protein ACTSR8_19345 [Promethearchaeota archaeon]
MGKITIGCPEGVSPELWEILEEWEYEDYGILTIINDSRIVKLRRDILFGNNHISALKAIKEKSFEDWERKLLRHIFKRCYNPTLPKGKQPPPVYFEEIQEIYESLTGKRYNHNNTTIPTTSSSTTTTRENVKTTTSACKNADHETKLSSVLDSQFFSSLNAIRGGIQIWVSKEPRDHYILISKRLEDMLFEKLVKGFNIEFCSKNGRGQVIYREQADQMGLCFSLSMSNEGKLDFRVPKNVPYEIFLRDLRRATPFLSEERFLELINAIRDNKNRRVFLHTANLIGPRVIVNKYFKNGAVLVNMQWGDDVKAIRVVFDCSTGYPELELQGEAESVKLLQSLIARPMEAVERIRNMELQLELIEKKLDLLVKNLE